MSKFFIVKRSDQATSGVFRTTFKYASAYAEGWEQFIPSIAIHEAAYKPEPKDVHVHWLLYYTLDGIEYWDGFSTRELARKEKKFLLSNLDIYPNKPTNIYIQREEVWVVDKKKVS